MKADTFLKQFEQLAEAPDGITKLRELILQLAVRGKLVEQDPDDEPASELLKKIQAQKHRLIDEGVIRKPKPLPPIEDEDLSFDLPVAWEEVRLGNLAALINGDRSKNYPSKDVLVTTGLPFINAGHLVAGRVSLHDMNYIPQDRFDLLRSGKIQIADILYCIRGSLGKSAIVTDLDEGAIASSLVIIRPFGWSDPSYLLLYLDSPLGQDMIRRFDNGSAQPNLAAGSVRLYSVPLPPLAEQKRIVAKVDELMALCDDLQAKQQAKRTKQIALNRASLHVLTEPNGTSLTAAWDRVRDHFDDLYTVPETVADLRQAILQLAVMGRLVPQNREDLPASELLKKIRVEKQRLIAEGVIRKSKPLPPSEFGYEMPGAWQAAHVQDVFYVSGGIQKTPARRPTRNHFPYLRVANVQRNALLLDEIERFELFEGELEKYRLQPGDLLVVEGNGSEREIGRCAEWSGEIEDCVHQNHLIRCRPLMRGLAPYVLLFLNSPHGRNEMKRLAITTSGLYNLSVGKIKRITVPIPPLAEQKRIVAKVDHLMTLCDDLEVKLQQAQTDADELLAAIVHELTQTGVNSQEGRPHGK